MMQINKQWRLSMSFDLNELCLKLNQYETTEGNRFTAEVIDELIEISCSNAEDFPIRLSVTNQQIIALSHLFSEDDIIAEELLSLNDTLLRLSPVIPLSSFGKDGKLYFIFGAMPLGTTFENLVHELEVQAENTVEALEILQELMVA